MLHRLRRMWSSLSTPSPRCWRRGVKFSSSEWSTQLRLTAEGTNSGSQKRSDRYIRRKPLRHILWHEERFCLKELRLSLWARLDITLYISPMEARRNVKMVLFERRDSNLKDYIEYIGMCGCLRLTEAVLRWINNNLQWGEKFYIAILLKIIRSVIVTQ